MTVAVSKVRLFPLPGQREGGPEVGIGKVFRVQQGQLRFAEGLGAGCAGAPAPDEFGHQLAGRFVVHFPVTGQHGLRPGDSEGAAQGHHAFTNLYFAQTEAAGAEDDQLGSLEGA